MIEHDIRLDIAEVKNSLQQLGVQTKYLSKTIARYVGYAVKKWIVKRMGGFFKSSQKGTALTGAKGGKLREGDTGKGLKGSLYFKPRQQGGVVTTALGYYGEILEKGGTINAKGDGYLTFRGQNGWVKKHSVTIPAKKWFSGASSGFDGSPQQRLAIEGPLATAIKRAGLRAD